MNKKIQDISFTFMIKVILLQGIAFLVLLFSIIFSTYLHKTELADQITSTVEGKMKNREMREVTHILSGVRDSFKAVDFYNQQGDHLFTFPTQFRSNISWIKQKWRAIYYSSYKKDIFFDIKEKNKMASVVFTFDILGLLPVAIAIWILGALVSYPFIRKYRMLIIDNFEKESLNEKSKALVELAEQVRHDSAAPLTAIKAVAETAKGLNETQKKVLDQAYNSVSAILEDLSSTKEKITHIYQLIENVIEQNRIGENNSKKLIFKATDRAKKAHIRIEKIEIQRILSNLINNAMESIDQSGEVIISLDCKNNNINIIIEDTGVGMSKEIASQAFDKGFSYGKLNGEGLGLYSAKNKIEAFGGKLKLVSKENIGTKVHLSIPA